MVKPFKFDKHTAKIFDDMLHRSIPQYDKIQRMILEFTEKYAVEGTNVYDLGCSTGTTLEQLVTVFDGKDISCIGIDSSSPMLSIASKKLKTKVPDKRWSLIEHDLERDIILENPSVVIANLTIQFLSVKVREKLISNIYKSLRPQGCFIWIEKIKNADPDLDALYIDIYYAFKKRNHYSEAEIEEKRQALENVLIPNTFSENAELLERAGFEKSEEFFRWFNFNGLLAVKS